MEDGPLKTDVVLGNFYSFECFLEVPIGGVTHIGFPKVALRNISDGRVRWGSKLDWSWPDPSKMRVKWVDHEHNGLTRRTLANLEDALGAEGTMSGKPCRFEQILDAGQSQVVYALYCPVEQFRLAYGFDRLIFEPAFVRQSPETE